MGYEDRPTLVTPFVTTIATALIIVLMVGIPSVPYWLNLFLVILMGMFGLTAFFTTLDWLTYRVSLRMRDLGEAHVYPAVMLANAVRDLTVDKTDLIRRYSAVEISALAAEHGPIWNVQCLTRNVPWEFVVDFLSKSVESDPYLWPVREAGEIGKTLDDDRGWPNSEMLATEVTNFIISRGWAAKSTGPFAAKLTQPLNIVAGYFGITVSA